MKILKKICFVALIGALSVSCKDESKPEIKTVDVEVSKKDVSETLDPNATYAKVEFGIDGMTCAMGCAKTIEKKMAKMEGVKSAKVDFDKRLAMVEYDEAKVSPETLEKTVVSVADTYTVKDMKIVEDFGVAKKACKVDCKKVCCAGDVKNEKEACAEDCKKDCCKAEKQAE
ncbi:heavy metal-associated domain-containing protein [uncultured Winogradskyella sp.]|uniref:heavy metal-associated domain-containing protein n=1 Tax=uncultured Winogradskyella sp. TaxID=395353 RepID=UPI0030DCE1F6|tara:strand:- start:191187 stop:191702 length:516 start_codon:yes stop_codon:yes gene_type:complete